MATERDEMVWELAGRQHGTVARRQLREIGFDAGAIGRRRRDGQLLEVGDGVFRVAGAPETERAALSAAMLEAGPTAVVSHPSAAALWGVPGFTALPAGVTAPGRPGKGGRPRLATVHQPRCLLDWHWVDVDGLRVTTPTRTLFDLAGLRWVHPKRVGRALDRLWAQGRVDHRSLRRMLDCLAKRGRPGITLMREHINARGEDYRPPESGAEGRFRELAVSWGHRSFEQQRDLGDENRWIGRVDFVDMEAGIVVEIDPAPFHSSLLDVAHDTARRERLRAAGLQVISVTERELFHAPAELRQLLAAAYRQSRAA
ncbi:MAG: hypothetical protein RIB98_16785 [Acidimicrobiales bacterium]